MDLQTLNRAALDPAASVVVSACAGSGKTWLLVSRIVRALLDGAQPSEILAITFTRKAAQEMAQRLREWLYALATSDDATVSRMLEEREVPAQRIAGLMPVARRLYEQFLAAEPGITITTFHSWFLQLLRRAPLDAGALGDVNLLEETAALVDEAWERFAMRLQREPQGAVSQGMDYLFTQYGIDSTRNVLMNFLYRRADWWAFADGDTEAVARALAQIAEAMDCAPDDDVPALLVEDASLWRQLDALAALLARNTKTDSARAEAIGQARQNADALTRFELIRSAVLKKDGDLFERKPSAAQSKRLGADGETSLLDLHQKIGARLQRALQDIVCQRNYRFNEAALRCGQALLEEYQSLKRDRRVIDYADIEWRTWQLLCDSEHAIYMLCKLDARYRHVLLDEFQDTNPLQWLTLQRWFESAAEVDARPQVFLVGDPKQSIYRFRRAEALLFEQAIDYLGAHFGAQVLPNDESRRCATPVIDVVNRVFAAQPGYDGFRTHTAHYAAKPGRVELWPLIGKDDAAPATGDGTLRNPFVMPLAVVEDSRRAREAALLAERITHITTHWWIAADDRGEHGRPATYADIMILVSRRTHLETYERALRQAGIPFVTSRHGGLLETLEVQDMVALLEFLVSPFADLKLAHALRSPLFSCSDDDLVRIAVAVRSTPGSTWWSALSAIAHAASATLARAQRLLSQWLARADTLPVHDQLDRIYFEADVLHRYDTAVPSAMRGAVAANLHAFMQRALDSDAGRYPSLPRFIGELADLKSAPAVESPDEGVVGDASDAVRIYTVHGAKGLEAPIVWLLDAAAGGNAQRGYETLLDWPVGASSPSHFSMWSRKDEQSPLQREILAREDALAAREDLNLLYVAMTRAQQALIVSGSDGRGRKESWYAKIAAAVAPGAEPDTEEMHAWGDLLEENKYEQKQIVTKTPLTEITIDIRLNQPLPTGVRRARISAAGLTYGTHFHLLMDQLTRTPPTAKPQLQRVLGVPDAEFEVLWRETQNLLTDAAYRRYFDPAAYVRAANELPFVTDTGEHLRIDRLVEFADEVCVLDYKTGAQSGVDDALLADYRIQISGYCRHMARAFPGKRVHGVIIFAGGGCVTITAPE